MEAVGAVESWEDTERAGLEAALAGFPTAEPFVDAGTDEWPVLNARP